MKRILFYCWGSISEQSAVKAMEKSGYEVFPCNQKIKDYHADAELSCFLFQMIQEKRIDGIFSFDYFPVLSMIAHVAKIPYMSWIYDCPLDTLLSKTVANPENYIFCFDQHYASELSGRNENSVYYFPLGTDYDGFQNRISKGPETFVRDISFVGNFYNGDDNRFRTLKLSPFTEGYAEGLIESQRRIYGYNFMKESLDRQAVEEIAEKAHLQLGDFYENSARSMVADLLNMEVSARERLEAVRLLSHYRKFYIYTNSSLADERIDLSGCHVCKGVDYQKEMPLIFANSKINLNITSKTIQTGISQRILDILACGGFCLTNYQAEIPMYFEDGKELVMYESMEDLLQKTEYYLSHEEERTAIARAGQRKVHEFFTIEKRIHDLLKIVYP